MKWDFRNFREKKPPTILQVFEVKKEMKAPLMESFTGYLTRVIEWSGILAFFLYMLVTFWATVDPEIEAWWFLGRWKPFTFVKGFPEELGDIPIKFGEKTIFLSEVGIPPIAILMFYMILAWFVLPNYMCKRIVMINQNRIFSYTMISKNEKKDGVFLCFKNETSGGNLMKLSSLIIDPGKNSVYLKDTNAFIGLKFDDKTRPLTKFIPETSNFGDTLIENIDMTLGIRIKSDGSDNDSIVIVPKGSNIMVHKPGYNIEVSELNKEDVKNYNGVLVGVKDSVIIPSYSGKDITYYIISDVTPDEVDSTKLFVTEAPIYGKITTGIRVKHICMSKLGEIPESKKQNTPHTVFTMFDDKVISRKALEIAESEIVAALINENLRIKRSLYLLESEMMVFLESLAERQMVQKATDLIIPSDESAPTPTKWLLKHWRGLAVLGFIIGASIAFYFVGKIKFWW